MDAHALTVAALAVSMTILFESDGTSLLPSRVEFAGKIDQSLRCTSEAFELSAVAVVLELTGPCGQVTISCNGAVVLADRIDSLTISGVANTLTKD